MGRQIHMMTSRSFAFASIVLLAAGAGLSWAQPASAPASKPADDTVLVRFGNGEASITQGEFNSYFYNGRPVPFETHKDTLIRELIDRKLLLLYLADHPDLLPDSKVDEAIENFRKQNNLIPQSEFDAFLKRGGFTPEVFRMRWRLQLAKAALLKKADPRLEEDKLKAEFDAHPEDYNGTQLTGRHILVAVSPTATPEERAAKKAKAEAMRQDLLSGKRTWTEAVLESDYPDRLTGGQLGYFARHRPIEQESLTTAAFAAEVNKIGELVETPLGYHILEVTSRTPGNRSFEESKADVRLWLSGMDGRLAMKEAKEKHKPVGLHAPEKPPPATAPALGQSTAGPTAPVRAPASRPVR